MSISRRTALQAIGGGLVAGTFNVWAAEPKRGMGPLPAKVEELDLWEKIHANNISFGSMRLEDGSLQEQTVSFYRFINDLGEEDYVEVPMELLSEEKIKQYKREIETQCLSKLETITSFEHGNTIKEQKECVRFIHLVFHKFHGLVGITSQKG